MRQFHPQPERRRARDSRRTGIFLASVALVVILAACGGGDPQGSADDGSTSAEIQETAADVGATDGQATETATDQAGGDTPIYGLVTSGTHPYYAPAEVESAKACEELGCDRLFTMPAEFDVQLGIATINDYMARGDLSGLAVSAADDKAMLPTLERIRDEQGEDFPIVTFNADCCPGIRTIAISNSDPEVGRLDAEALNALLPDGGKVLNIIGGVQLKNVRDRLETLKANLNPNITTVEVSDNNELDTTPQILRDSLTKDPNYDAILTQTGSSAVVCETLEQDGLDIPVVGLNSFDDVMAWVEEGCIVATIGLNPGLQGELAVRALDHLNDGMTLKDPANAFFGTSGVIITQANFDTWEQDIATLNDSLRADFEALWQ